MTRRFAPSSVIPAGICMLAGEVDEVDTRLEATGLLLPGVPVVTIHLRLPLRS